QALQTGVDALSAQLAERHGRVRDGDGHEQRLIVFGLGKLGGGELNFSSDVDLVYAYRETGQSDGPRPLEAEAWFTRLGQRLAQLLGDTTAEGFCHRVDPLQHEAQALLPRLGQLLAKLQGDTTTEGFCQPVDLRLRTFRTSGRLALRSNAMEQYFPR